MTNLYRDTENGNIITIDELAAEFDELKATTPDEYDYSFIQYLNNCLSKNGFLEAVKCG